MKEKLYKRFVFLGLGVVISILPPVLAVFSFFPIWCAEGGEYVVSGFTALVLLLCALPLFRLIKKLLASPSVWVMWLIAFIVFFALSKIADEMVVISFVGFVSNVLGAILFRLAKKYEEHKNEEL